MSENSSTQFQRTTELPTDSLTLIEGLPGLGLVASIAVDQITKQLELEQHGTIVSDDFPPVAAFDGGRVRDPVRVYAGEDPAVMTLQSDVPIPPTAVESLSQCVLNDLAEEFQRAIFLAGAPAESEDEIGDVIGVATTEQLETSLTDAGIPLAEGPGLSVVSLGPCWPTVTRTTFLQQSSSSARTLTSLTPEPPALSSKTHWNRSSSSTSIQRNSANRLKKFSNRNNRLPSNFSSINNNRSNNLR